MTSFHDACNKQVTFQRMIVENVEEEKCAIPCDSVYWFKYHMLAMMEELGEVLTSDKRWKTHRKKYNKDDKLDELADVLITFLNLLIYSGVSVDEMIEAVMGKIDKNTQRVIEANAKEGVDDANHI